MQKESYPGYLRAECCSWEVGNLILPFVELPFDLWKKYIHLIRTSTIKTIIIISAIFTTSDP